MTDEPDYETARVAFRWIGKKLTRMDWRGWTKTQKLRNFQYALRLQYAKAIDKRLIEPLTVSELAEIPVGKRR